MSARRAAVPRKAGAVVHLDEWRILQALARRERYKYVQPRLQHDGRGWLITSPNCSRSLHADGREIEIARLQPEGANWKLFARDHVLGVWVQKGRVMPLTQALALLAADPSREFWP